MRKEEYINEVISKIENKKARREVEKELSAHIDDRILYYTDAGYDEQTATEKAMEHMGKAEDIAEKMGKIHNRKKKVIIIVVSVICFIVFLPQLIIGIAFIGISSFNNSKPDDKKDTLIPSGYVETDGVQWYARDWCVFSYYVYSEKPELDDCFEPVNDKGKEKIQPIFDHFSSFYDEEESLLNSERLANCISDDDYFYFVCNYADSNDNGFVYYYDTQTKALFKLDFCCD